MEKKDIPEKVRVRAFHPASEEVEESLAGHLTEQTKSPTYKLAFADDRFLVRDEMRGVRLQLEFQKADLCQSEEGIQSTLVIFGSARIMERVVARVELAEAEEALDHLPNDSDLQARVERARNLVINSRFYDEARELARLASVDCRRLEEDHFVVTTGGGPGIMEAANRGAHDAGAKSIGLNIGLPHEQSPNPYITPDLCFQFHYFALRKMHFLMRARALVCFPGGFGTLDELFDALTLIQTQKMNPIPVLLVGKEHWKKVVNFKALVSTGLITVKENEIFEIVDTAKEAWESIKTFYGLE